MFGLMVGLVRMILDFSFKEPLCMEMDNRPFIVKQVTGISTDCTLRSRRYGILKEFR
jgi:hypothetical protein